MKKPKLKICGMKYNTAEVAELRPDYLGFVFYKLSPRFFDGVIPPIPSGIKKVGVFVDASVAEIAEKVKIHELDIIQLHGEESHQMCEKLIQNPGTAHVNIWKAFGVDDRFNFDRLLPFEPLVDKFLFDTKGKNKGGNGITFNWEVLKKYPSEKPFVLSGGIGLQALPGLRLLLKTRLPIHAIDINSRFEKEPGRKNIDSLKQFMDEL